MNSFWQVKTIGCYALALCCLTSSAVAHSQQLQVPSLPTGLPLAPVPTISSSASSSEDENTERTKQSTGDTNTNANDILTAGQITSILRSRPELITDIKQVMAD